MKYQLFTRKILLLCLLVAGLRSPAQISGFPHTESFDTETAGPTTCTGMQVLTNPTFHNINGDAKDWVARSGATPTAGTGPGSGYGGSGSYLYLESSGCHMQDAVLESQPLDFSTLSTVELHFGFHMYGTTMGSLTVTVSSDGGATWNPVWSLATNAGNLWHYDMVTLTTYAGQPNVLIRFEGVTGAGDYSDIAIDEVLIKGKVPPFPITETGTMLHADLGAYDTARVTFSKPGSDCETLLRSAELSLNLNLGARFSHGGTDFGGSITLDLDVTARDASGTILPACSRPVLLSLGDSLHPEQQLVLSFADCYGSIDHFDIAIRGYSTGTPAFMSLLDSIRFDVDVAIAHYVGGLHKTTPSTLMITTDEPVISSTDVVPAHFSWTGLCDFPLYQFQLLRVYNLKSTKTDSTDIDTRVTEADWRRSALTLETREQSIDLTLMEGTGYYLWRVRPIGDLHAGELADPRNYGHYTTAPASTPPALLTVDPTLDAANKSVFFFVDPAETRNREFARSFSSGALADGRRSLRQQERAIYYTEDMFARQTQRVSNSQGAVMLQQQLRDYSGRNQLELNGVPIEKSDMNFVPQVLRDGSGALYNATHFDGATTYGQPDPLGAGPLHDYYSDANPDKAVPNASGYPFRATLQRNDGTGRISEGGIEGPIMRLGGSYTTKTYYSSVADRELTRVFGHEAPATGTVEKVVTVSPDKVTVVAYINQAGKTIATCYAKNSDMSAYVSEAPGSGFTLNDTLIGDEDASPYKISLSRGLVFTEPTSISVDYTLTPATFSTSCLSYCAECDYKVEIEVIPVADPSSRITRSTVIGGGACPGGSAGSISPLTATLSPGEYLLVKTVTLNGTDPATVTSGNPLGQTYLEGHMVAVRDSLSGQLAAVADTLHSLLDSIRTGVDDLSTLYGYAKSHADDFDIAGGDTLGYFFAVNGCDTLYLERQDCPGYDCVGKGYADFFHDIVESFLLQERNAGGTWDDPVLDVIGHDLGLNGSASSASINTVELNTGLTASEFNTLMNNMVADGTAEPTIFTGYTCPNIFAVLDGLAHSYAYDYARIDYDIVGTTIANLGYHYKTYTNVAGTIGGSVDGYRTHPHKYLEYTAGAAPDCETTSDFAALPSLVYTDSADRAKIEGILYAMQRCMTAPSMASVHDLLGVDINAKNIVDKLKDNCERLIAAKEDVFRAEVEALMASEGKLPTDPGYATERACRTHMLMDYARSQCDLTVTESSMYSGHVPSGFLHPVEPRLYKVDGPLGSYIEYNGSDYGPNTAGGQFFTSRPGIMAYSTYGAGITVREYTGSISQVGTQAEVDTLSAVLAGAVSLCASACGPDYVYVDSATLVPGPPVLAETFDAATGPGPVVTHLATWKASYGTPTVEAASDAAHRPYVLSLQSYKNQTTGKVNGDGAYKEAFLPLAPGQTYEISFDYKLAPGSAAMDNLYFMLDEWSLTDFKAEVAGEVVYPDTRAYLLAHLSGLLNGTDWTHRTIRFSIPTSYTDTQYRLYIYPRQEINSDTARVLLDNIDVVPLVPSSCSGMYVKFEIGSPDPAEAYAFLPAECGELTAASLDAALSQQEASMLAAAADALQASYRSACPFPTELFTAEYELNYYHYTLFYFDASGQLIKSVPPKGVAIDDGYTRADVPGHSFVTEYRYDGLGRLASRKTPDAGEATNFYDDLERMRFTQTAQDLLDGVYRYICYDAWGRPVEAGVNQLGPDVLTDHVNDRLWPANTGCANCSERRYTVYSTPDPVHTDFAQRNLLNRVSYVHTDAGAYTSFSYDAHGKVTDILQDIPGLGLNTLHYDYDLYSDQLVLASLNPGRSDQFFFRYAYDEDGRKVAAYSSTDKQLWTLDQESEFFAHGALRRNAYGHYGVQGLDFTYNLHRALIGLNTPALDVSDPGQDGFAGAHAHFGRDLFGQEQSYYVGDFDRSGSVFKDTTALHLSGADLHNGRISAVTFQQAYPFGNYDQVNGHVHGYDEFGRLRSSDHQAFGGSSWTTTGDYSVGLDYDKNGNISSLSRTAFGSSPDMDDLTYHYTHSGTNRLGYITDPKDQPFSTDLPNQDPANYAYDADGRLIADSSEHIDRVFWQADGKVREVWKSTGDTIRFTYDGLGHRVAKIHTNTGGLVKATYYVVTADGSQLAVYTDDGTDTLLTEVVIESGTYSPGSEVVFNDTLPVADSVRSRLMGRRSFSLLDHLGNVRTVFSDYKVAADTNSDGHIDVQSAVVLSAQDYYPHGMTMPGRAHNSSTYRYGFQNKEADAEIKGEGNSYDFHARFLDPRVGRWLSTDPMEQDFPSRSPYVSMGNDPIAFVDPNGETEKPASADFEAVLAKFALVYGVDIRASFSNSNNSSPKDLEDMVCRYSQSDQTRLYGGVGKGLVGEALVAAYANTTTTNPIMPFTYSTISTTGGVFNSSPDDVVGVGPVVNARLFIPSPAGNYEHYEAFCMNWDIYEPTTGAVIGEKYTCHDEQPLPKTTGVRMGVLKLSMEVKTNQPNNGAQPFKDGVSQLVSRDGFLGLGFSSWAHGYDYRMVLVMDRDAFVNAYNSDPAVQALYKQHFYTTPSTPGSTEASIIAAHDTNSGDKFYLWLIPDLNSAAITTLHDLALDAWSAGACDSHPQRNPKVKTTK